jgi:hypothetical protein
MRVATAPRPVARNCRSGVGRQLRSTGGPAQSLPVSLFAQDPPAARPTPRVDIRFPRRLLILPIVFIGFLVSIIVRVVDRSLFGDRASTDSVPGVALTIALVGVLPLLAVLGYARSAVRSDGRVLRVRSGFVTRTIPAADIDGFVLVGSLRRTLPLQVRCSSSDRDPAGIAFGAWWSAGRHRCRGSGQGVVEPKRR